MIEVLPNWHPIFVHFSVALLMTAVLLHLVSHFVKNEILSRHSALVGRWNLWLGTGFTIFTVTAGWFAYYSVKHDTPTHLAMTDHRNWAMVTFVLFLGIVAWEFVLQRRGQGRSWLFTLLLMTGAGLLLSTAWRGGELVYRHGLGVMSMPKAEGEGHTHEHGEGQGHGDMPAQHDAMPPTEGHAHSSDGMESNHHADTLMPGKTESTTPESHPHAPGTAPHKD